MRRRHRRQNRLQVCLVSFGIGLLACFLFPLKLVVVCLGIALILCGICDR